MARGKRNDLQVITKAKDLASYVFAVTASSPKKFRASLVQRLQDGSMDIIHSLIKANVVNVPAADDKARAIAVRRGHQRDALTSLRLLVVTAQIACEQCCILTRHYEQISRQAAEVETMLFAWSKSDRSRYGG